VTYEEGEQTLADAGAGEPLCDLRRKLGQAGALGLDREVCLHAGAPVGAS
jgi:hypothetical protein